MNTRIHTIPPGKDTGSILPVRSMFSRADCPITVLKFKICCSCNGFKSFDEFHNNKKAKDGKQGKCKKCTNEYLSKYRKENRWELNCKRDYNCKKYKAQQKVRTAVKRGELIKTTCEQCDSNNKTIGHHDDYDNPLEVRWLCVVCHGAWHMENGEAKNAK